MNLLQPPAEMKFSNPSKEDYHQVMTQVFNFYSSAILAKAKHKKKANLPPDLKLTFPTNISEIYTFKYNNFINMRTRHDDNLLIITVRLRDRTTKQYPTSIQLLNRNIQNLIANHHFAIKELSVRMHYSHYTDNRTYAPSIDIRWIRKANGGSNSYQRVQLSVPTSKTAVYMTKTVTIPCATPSVARALVGIYIQLYFNQ